MGVKRNSNTMVAVQHSMVIEQSACSNNVEKGLVFYGVSISRLKYENCQDHEH